MKLLLIQPANVVPLIDHVFVFEPLALEYVGAGAKLDGHDVVLIDARLEPDVERVAREYKPDVVGITAFTSQVNMVKRMAARLRAICPAAFIIVGGHHATVRPRDFSGPEFDAVVIGEGVFTLREMLKAMRGEGDLRSIPGVAFPSPGKPESMVFTEPRRYTDLNALPFPDRTLTARYRRHYFSEWFKPLASIRTSLGCTARCTFCALWSITGGKYLRRDPDSVVAELKTIEEQNVFFCDDESMCDVKRMAALAEKIRAAGIRKKYFLYARADTIAKHPELFEQWAAIGLKQVFVGMEDFSDARLEAMKKRVTTNDQAEAVKILRRLGISMYASFMVDPAYTREDFRSMRAYIRKLKLRVATFTVMTPLPGTELHHSHEKELLSRRPELYDLLHALLPTTLPLPEFYEEFAQLYRTAVPLHRGLATIWHFGLKGIALRLKLMDAFLKHVRNSHLEYDDSCEGGAKAEIMASAPV